ncbi:GNAT family N-acetyltransferase [Liquorilactobacillus hordei]|uniref:GNAT family N-acetyltransferase n=1 Tax=Liquorilactobacillus hordei TaxID=468911 RepID=A0A3S6QWC9_9LACO|nr:GNAT family protein [Liquorilactobacillus hordei]AUJ30487.1 GNAT family N-acetyltransferase [Liquorilactobacillus hordei]
MFTYKIDSEVSLALPRPKIDAAPLFQIIKESHEELQVWLPWVPSMKSIEDEETFLGGVLKNFGNERSLNTVILYRDTPVGMISFNKFNTTNQCADIGYWLGTKHVGNGIVHRAVAGMCTIGFTDYDIHKIEIHAAVENVRSNQVAKKAGFHLDGLLRANELLADGFHDENVWSLLREEWEKH